MNVLLIDLSAIAHALFHVSGNEPDPNWVSTQTVARVRALASGQPHVAVCAEGGRSFRKGISADYKANRPESQPALQHQIATALEVLRADGFPCWSVPTFEADDVIATACGTALIRDDVTVTIATSDKDLLQLVSDRVQVKSLRDGSLLGNAEVMAKLSVRPDQVRDYLALVGDASDNIKGANGIGPKKAAELLTKYGNLEDVYAALTNHGTQFTPSMATALREFEPRLKTVRELLTLRTDVPIPVEEVWRERLPQDVAVFGDDESMGIASDIEESMPTLETPAAVQAAVGPPTDGKSAVMVPSVSNGGDSKQESYSGVEGEARRLPTGGSTDVVPSQGKSGQQALEVTPAPAEWDRALEPRDLNQALTLAKAMFASRLFSAYGNMEGIFSTILAGRELGLPAMSSLRAFHIIEGKPTLSADLIRALVLKSGKAEYFRCSERTPEKATFVTKRKGEPEIALTFTVEEGRKAFARNDAAWAASGWGKNPADMCVARASAKLARLVYADIVSNLYSDAEFD